ncbi:TPA: hypothetical protein TUM69_001654 [Streptococcus equi subsp. zooepidemicus]|nr:hypothetical protein [Streptococcus equi subsp. zooepidemicus]HEL0429291.1 hypothetical protein [Streptococcus equi subsp. zooepidemicus]HEL0431426.1 hypothetical protein [Streptococcus equi subsp. zooepidemicus]HEL0435551.1 hypothetical protein [Streptococcus equi subsp. zooepidemicus]HEL0439663.1 hypothetical protein [Streptococcus equi subsp. zooepidemicus]
MAFYKKGNGYSSSLAEELLGNEVIKLTGKQIENQYEFVQTGEIVNGKEKMKRTNNVQAHHVYVATDSQNPFKIKFLVENKPDLSGLEIGDTVEFEGLEAFENNYGQVYFRATGIMKGK